MPSSDFVDLPQYALHLIYSNLLPRQCVLLSQTGRKLRQAATTLPRRFKRDIILMLDSAETGDSFGLQFLPVSENVALNRDLFEQRFSKEDKAPMFKRINDWEKNFMMKRRYETIQDLMDALKPLLRVTSLAKCELTTNLPDIVRLHWFSLIRYLTGNKKQPLSFHVTFMIRPQLANSEGSDCQRSLVDVIRRASLAVLLWNFANAGITSLDLSYPISFGVFTSFRFDWFAHLKLSFIVFPCQITTQSMSDFEQFLRVFLEGGLKGSSFELVLMVPYADRYVVKIVDPFAEQMENIRSELGQPKMVCYHKDVHASGMITVWRTMNKAQYRISWQGPILQEHWEGVYVRVKGFVDSDDAVPRTRKLTPALQKQVDSNLRHSLL